MSFSLILLLLLAVYAVFVEFYRLRPLRRQIGQILASQKATESELKRVRPELARMAGAKSGVTPPKLVG